MRYDKTVEIGGETYKIVMLPATKSLAVFTKLMRLIGKPLAAAAGGVDKQVEDVLPLMMDALIERLDDKEIETLIKKDLLPSVLYNNQPLDGIFDVHFQGRIGALFQVIFEVVKFQYADFIDVLASIMAKVKDKMPGLNVPSISSGQSGASSLPARGRSKS